MLTSFCRICWLSNTKSAAIAKASYQSLHEKSLVKSSRVKLVPVHNFSNKMNMFQQTHVHIFGEMMSDC